MEMRDESPTRSYSHARKLATKAREMCDVEPPLARGSSIGGAADNESPMLAWSATLKPIQFDSAAFI